jgi:glucose-1-phosphate thymidylyltransferase
MKGIILAGGRGTRLYPLTHAISKQLLPVYKNPMIYYPIMTLRDMGITDIMIITTPEQQPLYKQALQHVTQVNLIFEVQPEPAGLPQAFIIAESWLAGDDVALVLGDNIIINNAPISPVINSIFTFEVTHPERYGVVDIKHGYIKNIVEKPQTFVSNDAVIGLYVFDNNACEIAKNLKPSARGELEIVDLIKAINDISSVYVQKLDGFWFDAGNHDDLLDCANMVRAIEQRSSKKFTLQ